MWVTVRGNYCTTVSTETLPHALVNTEFPQAYVEMVVQICGVSEVYVAGLTEDLACGMWHVGWGGIR